MLLIGLSSLQHTIAFFNQYSLKSKNWTLLNDFKIKYDKRETRRGFEENESDFPLFFQFKLSNEAGLDTEFKFIKSIQIGSNAKNKLSSDIFVLDQYTKLPVQFPLNEFQVNLTTIIIKIFFIYKSSFAFLIQG